MMKSKAEAIPYVDPIPEERSLVRRAKAGDSEAFIGLYDAYGDELFRYVYFRVLSDVAAEAITSQVFRHAWEHLAAYRRKRDASFVAWIYRIARTQVLIYYQANLKTSAFNIGSVLVAADYGMSEKAQNPFPVDSWGHHLRLLTGDIEQSRLQTTAALIMRRYLEYLVPGGLKKPSPTFNAYTRTWLLRYLKLHERPSAAMRMRRRIDETIAATRRAIPPVRIPRLTLPPLAQRMSVTYAMLIGALLITGTARAQSALPGDLLYGWKRTSEQAWLAVSPDPVGTEITLADRRLDEWLAVENDPQRSVAARNDYVSALVDLHASGDVQAQERIKPVLAQHRKKLDNSGLGSQPITSYLTAVQATPVSTTSSGATDSVVIGIPPTLVSAPTEASTEPTLASVVIIPTDIIPPTATDVPTATDTPVPTVAPTATDVPTATPVPTDVPPTPTDVPTDVPPTATDVPTDVAPAPTSAPTDVVPTSTVPVTSLDSAPLTP